MYRAIKKLPYLVALLIFSFYSGCTDFPGKLIMPTWNVDLNVPVYNRSYTLQDAINKDSSMVKSYTDPARLGLLYYSNTKPIDAVTVGNNLTMDPFSTDASVKLDSVTINTPTPVRANISLNDLGSPIPPGSQNVIFPPIPPTQVNKNLETISQFQSAIFSTAIIKITFKNKMPVSATITGFTLQNINNGSIIFQDNTQRTVNANDSTTVLYSITDSVTVTQNIKMQATISSPGSNGKPVNVANDAGIGIAASVENFSIYQVTADLPPQAPFNFNSTFTIDDSTYVQNAVLKSGQLSLTISNGLDIALNTNVVIHNMYDANGNEFTINVSLARKQQNKVINISSLAGYSFRGPGNTLTNQLPYDVTVQTSATNGVVTLTKTDFVHAVANLSGIIVQTFSGKIKPTHVNVDKRTFSLGLGDVKNKYSLSQINISDANVQIKLKQSTGIEVGYSGQIIGKNATQTRTMSIPYSVLGQGENTITLDKTQFQNFLNGFTGKLPDSLIVEGSGIANPNYKVGNVSSTDSIYGNADVEIPLKIGISGGSFADTTDLNFDNDVRNKKDKIGKFSVTIELSNGVPAGFSFSGKVYDSAGVFLMDLPPNRAPNPQSVTIPAAAVDANGDVTGPSSNKIVIELNQDEINKFLSGHKLINNISFNTSGTNAQAVKFKTGNPFSVRIYGSATYKIEP